MDFIGLPSGLAEDRGRGERGKKRKFRIRAWIRWCIGRSSDSIGVGGNYGSQQGPGLGGASEDCPIRSERKRNFASIHWISLDC